MCFSPVRRSFLLAVAGALVALAAPTGAARAEFLVALGSTATTGNALVTVDSNSFTTVGGVVAITGVTGSLLDIDYRPATGALYGLGSNGTLYTINTVTGVASFASTISAALSGNQFAIDYNPTVDRLRLVSDTGQNLRINVDTGAATVDGTLSTTGVVGAAYTNSFAGATATTLYDLTRTGNSFNLNIQNPPNNGTLVTVGGTGIFSPSSSVGFDISGATGLAYVATNAAASISSNGFNLATIDLATGNLTGSSTVLGAGSGFQVRGLAAPLGAAVPEPASVAMLAVGLAGAGFMARRRVARTS